jgi:hypothetical protein
MPHHFVDVATMEQLFVTADVIGAALFHDQDGV